MANAQDIRFDDQGLVPCVAQDQATGEVLMVAWMNRDAFDLTQSTGDLHFWSRSRKEIWHKGATSGNTLAVAELRLDCDGDTLVALVDPAGPACHTGARTCFQDGEPDNPAIHEVLPGLARTIAERLLSGDAESSWTAKLLANATLAGEKVEEEAEEVVRAVRDETDERCAEEAADLLYHLLVLLKTRGLDFADVARVLASRRGA
ncbi:MAG: bifunctional phosphoribosyl-AMP cyclohydrolase/phosphoribosyl-ATP diphosphatase HisIE [Solirubrobacterales bacterium]|nr:bifunctional phosphoribosyl-AMP cyclohydrolase/phosphoribosyl-ATP diphosphatase HisIE [Solirubrobacterales bacterium]